MTVLNLYGWLTQNRPSEIITHIYFNPALKNNPLLQEVISSSNQPAEFEDGSVLNIPTVLVESNLLPQDKFYFKSPILTGCCNLHTGLIDYQFTHLRQGLDWIFSELPITKETIQ